MAKRAAPSPEVGGRHGKRKCSTARPHPETAPPADDSSTGPGRGMAPPLLVAATPWISSKISPDLPPLPSVLDPELEETAFTHPGMGLARNYERLEWLGDAYLELVASSLIFQTFTRTPSGRCSQLRELLIRNTTLAEYFRRYDLHLRARIPADVAASEGRAKGSSNDKDLIKTQGDMFEAYVAAVIVSDPAHGLARAVGWLKALWGHTIRDQIEANERLLAAAAPCVVDAPGGGQRNPKDRLREIVWTQGVTIRYEDIPGDKKDKHHGLPLFTVGVYVDGWGEYNKLLGTGTALQKKEAGHRAAAKALENKKLMKMYEAKRAALRDAEDGGGSCGPDEEEDAGHTTHGSGGP